MMEASFFFKGFCVGFGMAVPIGPIGILCVRKTLAEGLLRGRIIGLGAATADLLYGGVAAFGVTLISALFMSQMVWLRPVGGAVLLVVGIRIFGAQPADPAGPAPNGSLLRSYASTMLLTLTNPLTLFGFVAAFAAWGLGSGLNAESTLALVVGVFVGSCAWFLVLTSGAAHFRSHLDLAGLRWVNRIAGSLIILSGVLGFIRPL